MRIRKGSLSMTSMTGPGAVNECGIRVVLCLGLGNSASGDLAGVLDLRNSGGACD